MMNDKETDEWLRVNSRVSTLENQIEQRKAIRDSRIELIEKLIGDCKDLRHNLLGFVNLFNARRDDNPEILTLTEEFLLADAKITLDRLGELNEH